MLLGLYTSILDNSNNVTLPRELGEQLKEGVYVTQGFDRNIMVLTHEAFETVYQKITSANIADPIARLLLRMILGSAYETELKADGIAIMDSLKSFAKLGKEAIVVGQGDYLEIWSPEYWAQQRDQFMDVEKNPGRFSSLVISTQ